MLNLTRMLSSLRPQIPAATIELDNEAEKILSSLERIQKTHALIYVSLGSKGEHAYQSIIVDVDRQNAAIEIDKLFPDGLLLNEGDRVSVTIRHSREQSLTFQSRVAKRRDEGQAISYTLSLPNHLDGHQRREAFRLPTRGQIRWQDEQSNEAEAAHITNISVTGVQFALPLALESTLEVGEQIADCHLQLASLDLICDLRVTRKSPSERDPEITNIGAKLVTLDPEKRRKLEQFIMREQRYQRVYNNR